MDQVFGGIPGSGTRRALIAVVATFYGLSIIAGALMLRGHRFGTTLTAILQLPQLIQVYGPALTVYCFTGAMAAVVLKSNGVVALNGMLGSGFTFELESSSEPAGLGLNVVAAWVLWTIWHTPEPSSGASKQSPTMLQPATKDR